MPGMSRKPTILPFRLNELTEIICAYVSPLSGIFLLLLKSFTDMFVSLRVYFTLQTVPGIPHPGYIFDAGVIVALYFVKERFAGLKTIVPWHMMEPE